MALQGSVLRFDTHGEKASWVERVSATPSAVLQSVPFSVDRRWSEQFMNTFGRLSHPEARDADSLAALGRLRGGYGISM